MKKILITLWSLMFMMHLHAQERQVIDKVVGVVGRELILLSDVEDQHSLLQKQRTDLPENAKCAIMDNVLAQNLLLNQARLDSIEVGEAEVESQLDARIQQILAYMNGDTKAFEDYYGASINDVKQQFREDLRNKLLIERMQGQIIADATVTPSEVKAFFARIPQDSLPYFNSEVEVAEIVYYPKVNDKERTAALEKLEEIKTKIEAGEDFAALAKRHSDDLGSGQQGGDLGFAQRGQFVPEFEGAAYNLKNGQLSEIVETEFGFHLIQLIERRGNNIHARHILIKPKITDADLDLAAAKLDSIRKLIVVDSMPFQYAVKLFSNEKEQSYSNGGNLVNPKTGNTFYEIADLDPDIYFTIDTMGVNDVSAPFAFNVGPDETAFRIVQLRSRTKPHQASLQEDYSKIKQATLEAKKNDFMTKWVDEKIESSYINIDPSFQTCELLKKWQVNK